ncbi:hypothetical protein CEUSTIGMA_g2417.t1 [Chlamydomonas eustigma]|uniref:sn-1-specific diacylglycerol lipase n=1 Tax=Chlamydomonas eustigma TaxID=1157962 RepID=A0A250WVX6_9CHLO|nr:hypothetical protein CEUSTIGMA_g2417.t1 [Chlamydomonas eustigma]|eukprot:GAX74971.1 hypothetical protein CEUSTIGMA_g2417.t1 [Chlamydomonas eustigma]
MLKNGGEEDCDHVWEQRTWFCCLGWVGPMFAPTWVGSKGLQMTLGRPSTAAYRKVLAGLDLDGPEWDWFIVVDENTDDLGWQYGALNFWELKRRRLAGRNWPRKGDFVRRRKWVHRDNLRVHVSSGQRGSVKYLDPKDMYMQRLEAQKKLEAATAAIWDILDELDGTVKIKELYSALLDPIAMNAVANKHIKVMYHDQQMALYLNPPAVLPKAEIWPSETLTNTTAPLHTRSNQRAMPQLDAHDDSPFSAPVQVSIPTSHHHYPIVVKDILGLRVADDDPSFKCQLSPLPTTSSPLVTSNTTIRATQQNGRDSTSYFVQAAADVMDELASATAGKHSSAVHQLSASHLSSQSIIPTTTQLFHSSTSPLLSATTPTSDHTKVPEGGHLRQVGQFYPLPSIPHPLSRHYEGFQTVTSAQDSHLLTSDPPTFLMDSATTQPSYPPALPVDSATTQPSYPPALPVDSATTQPSYPPALPVDSATTQPSYPPALPVDSATTQPSYPPALPVDSATTQPSYPPALPVDSATTQHFCDPALPMDSDTTQPSAHVAVTQRGVDEHVADHHQFRQSQEVLVVGASSAEGGVRRNRSNQVLNNEIETWRSELPQQPDFPVFNLGALPRGLLVNNHTPAAVAPRGLVLSPFHNLGQESSACYRAPSSPGTLLMPSPSLQQGVERSRESLMVDSTSKLLPSTLISNSTSPSSHTVLTHLKRANSADGAHSRASDHNSTLHRQHSPIGRKLRREALSLLDKTFPAFQFRNLISDEEEKGGALPPAMKLSIAELKCASGHALGVYGDLDVFIGGMPAQTFCDAISKFTGVPSEDILLVNWKTEPFRPAHYLAIDRLAKKIIICIRGTVEHADVITDFMCRPINYEFSPDMKGQVHDGILRSAKYVLSSVWEKLQQALREAPDLPILVTGHSLGGSTAAVVAMLLRNETRLLRKVKCTVRAVCLGPATTADLDLAMSCRSFVASVIVGCDMVPRIGVHSFSHFVHEVAAASAIKQLLLRIKGLWGQATQVLRKPQFKTKRLYPPGALLWVIRKDQVLTLAPKRRRASTPVGGRPPISFFTNLFTFSRASTSNVERNGNNQNTLPAAVSASSSQSSLLTLNPEAAASQASPSPTSLIPLQSTAPDSTALVQALMIHLDRPANCVKEGNAMNPKELNAMRHAEIELTDGALQGSHQHQVQQNSKGLHADSLIMDEPQNPDTRRTVLESPGLTSLQPASMGPSSQHVIATSSIMQGGWRAGAAFTTGHTLVPAHESLGGHGRLNASVAELLPKSSAPQRRRPQLELRYVDSKTFTKLLFFRQAVLDHYLLEYLQVLRTVVLEQGMLSYSAHL